MANVIKSPNMTLSVPVPSVCPAPQWAQAVYACIYGGIDQHNHSSGHGVQIQPSGIDISSNLSFNNNSAIALQTTTYQDQGSSLASSFLGCLYIAGGNLYYNAGADGFAVQITSGHSVTGSAGTITGLPSGTASASYSAGTFTFQSATSTPANIDGGSINIREVAASANAITLSSPTALAGNYTLILPTALPGAQSFTTIDASGNVASYVPVAGGITATNMAANSIATASIQDGAVTTAKRATVNAVTVNFTATSSTANYPTATAVTSAVATITCSGTQAVIINIGGRAASSGASAFVRVVGSNEEAVGLLTLHKDGGNELQLWQLSSFLGAASATSLQSDWPLSMTFIDFPTAGSHTYSLAISNVPTGVGSHTTSISDGLISVTEL